MNATSPRRRLRRGVVILPSAFTIGNLFLGIWAIVSASRGNFEFAGWLIVLAAVADMLDGRVARFTATGTAFGEELDSLVDAISFGVAPALIMYFLFFVHEGPWSWILSFIYIVGAICRLARFNIEQAGTAKTAFHGLPSPTAGVTLATYYAFTQTDVFARYFSRVNAPQFASWLMIALAGLMVSNVLYPVVPKFGLRTWGGRIAMLVAVLMLVAAFMVPELFFFPLAIAYIAWGLLRTVVEGFQERLPDRDPLVDEDDDDEAREVAYEDIHPTRRIRPDGRPHEDEVQP
ncbi:MAG TPA: CDP-diacylglycerol--serine O-phosphatidyltransferase [Longimicrobiaceae bacterium]|jgi:CDP-diacylglycerol--serine O-phosphatidyltransferase|nr:CDP-diacylglycerol--serine O-phosphatidyltransferase [Longimicrobiaceae bacterium]